MAETKKGPNPVRSSTEQVVDVLLRKSQEQDVEATPYNPVASKEEIEKVEEITKQLKRDFAKKKA